MQGTQELEAQEKLLAQLLERKQVVQLGGEHGKQQHWGRAYAVVMRTHNLAAIELRSEVGNRLAEASLADGLAPVGVLAYTEPGIGDSSKCKVSLRGKGTVDTSTMCKHFGGGGHALASSCITSWSEFDSWLRDD